MRMQARQNSIFGGLALLLVLAGPLTAQVIGQDRDQDRGNAPAANTGPLPVPGPGPSPILTLNQDRLFQNADWSREMIARAEAATADLAAENRGIEAELEETERALTDKRRSMSAAEFAPLARDFDVRVEEARQSQDAKSRAITRGLEEDRQRFLQAIRPILAELMLREGAQAVLVEGAMIVSRGDIDVTDEAVALINQRLPPPVGDGNEALPVPQISPAQPGGDGTPMQPPEASPTSRPD